MTDEARARAIVDVLRGTINNLKQGYSFTSSVLDTLELTEQFMQQEIAKALRDERRRVWEAAAKIVEGKRNNWTGLAAYSAEQTALEIACELRQQAHKEAQP